MDYLVKNGAPRVVQDIKDELYKVRTYNNFSYTENGSDHGQGGKFSQRHFDNRVIVRDKSRELVELLENPT
jgi:epsin